MSGGGRGGCGEVTSRGRSTTGKVIYLQTLWGGIIYGVYLVMPSIGLEGTGCCPTKGFKCQGVEGEDVVRLLHEAAQRQVNLFTNIMGMNNIWVYSVMYSIGLGGVDCCPIIVR